MNELPAGIVTFLFTDIEDSTGLARTLGERWPQVMSEHQRLLRAVFAGCGGQEINTQGDSFFVAFASAHDAVRAALEGQRALAAHPWPEGLEVKVRIGMHTGQTTPKDGRYFGVGVHRAARIMAAGRGGQIIVSASTQGLLADDPPSDIEFRDLGEHELKGLDRVERLYEAVPKDARTRLKGPHRVVVADDSVLLREGLARLLADAGFDVVATAADAKELIRAVDAEQPTIAVTDIKMPPTHTDEGLVAAEQIRCKHPHVGVLVLSQYLDSWYAMRLLEHYPERVGYMLKDRVSDVAVLTDAIRRIGEGECVVDPTIISHLMGRVRHGGPLSELTGDELDLLGLIAEGHSDEAIGERLRIDHAAVEEAVRTVFQKLGVRGSTDELRRLVYALEALRSSV